MISTAAFAEIPNWAEMLIILSAFTVSFVVCGIVTYRIRTKKSKNKKDKD